MDKSGGHPQTPAKGGSTPSGLSQTHISKQLVNTLFLDKVPTPV